MKQLLLSILCFTALIMPVLSSANTMVGNGGHVVEIKGKYYLWDLYRSGLEEHPYFNPRYQAKKSVLASLKVNTPFSLAERKLIGQKLAEIEAYSPIGSYILASFFKKISWRVVNLPLTPIELKDDLLPKNTKVYQFARRDRSSVRINRRLWEKMEIKHRVAGIFHEIFYTDRIAGPFSINVFTSEEISTDVFETIGYLFSKDMKSKGSNSFHKAWKSSNSRNSSVAQRIKKFIVIPESAGYSEEIIILEYYFEVRIDGRTVQRLRLPASLDFLKSPLLDDLFCNSYDGKELGFGMYRASALTTDPNKSDGFDYDFMDQIYKPFFRKDSEFAIDSPEQCKEKYSSILQVIKNMLEGYDRSNWIYQSGQK